jgi:hypothetical protein
LKWVCFISVVGRIGNPLIRRNTIPTNNTSQPV